MNLRGHWQLNGWLEVYKWFGECIRRTRGPGRGVTIIVRRIGRDKFENLIENRMNGDVGLGREEEGNGSTCFPPALTFRFKRY